MATATIIPITTGTTSQLPHPDKTLLTYVGRWNLACAKAELMWAGHDLDTKYGAIEIDLSPDVSEYLDEVSQVESFLTTWKPHTTRGAHVLLELAGKMLAYRERDPNHSLGIGPVSEIIRNVSLALSCNDIQLDKV